LRAVTTAHGRSRELWRCFSLGIAVLLDFFNEALTASRVAPACSQAWAAPRVHRGTSFERIGDRQSAPPIPLVEISQLWAEAKSELMVICPKIHAICPHAKWRFHLVGDEPPASPRVARMLVWFGFMVTMDASQCALSMRLVHVSSGRGRSQRSHGARARSVCTVWVCKRYVQEGQFSMDWNSPRPAPACARHVLPVCRAH